MLGRFVNDKEATRIIYARLRLAEEIRRSVSPPGRVYRPHDLSDDSERSAFSAADIVSECEVRSISYLSRMFGEAKAKPPLISHSGDISRAYDSNTIAIGGPKSNNASEYILRLPENSILTMDYDSIRSVRSKEIIVTDNAEFAYGFIVRLASRQQRGRVFVVCAGIGEWGTSGSAYYLARNWQVLYRRIKPRWLPWCFRSNRDWAAVVRVQRGHDPSADLVAFYVRPEDVRPILPVGGTSSPGIDPGTFASAGTETHIVREVSDTSAHPDEGD